MLRLDKRLSLALPALAAFVAHARALGGEYLWLDHTHLEQRAALAAPADWLSLFQQGFAGTGFYRPLTALSFSLDAALWGTPFGYRFVTLAWHALAATMTSLAARRLGGLSPRAALVAGLIVAIHPAGSLVADAIAFRSESMIAVFLLGLVIAHLARKPWLAALALAAGSLTKETAFVLGPLLIFALEVREAFSSVGPSRPLRARASLYAAELAALLLTGVLRLTYAPHWRAPFPALTFNEQLGTRLAAFARSSALLLVPIDGTVCDASAVVPLTNVTALLGLGGLALLAYVVHRERTIAPLFALALLPSLNLVPVMRFWSPHYLYVPLTFGAMLAAKAFDRYERVLSPVAVAAGAGWLFLSFSQAGRYLNDAALFRPEVARRPECREAQFFLGEVARLEKDWETAARRYEAAIQSDPSILAYVDRGAALQNLGAARFAQNRFVEAERAWTQALELSRDPGQQRRLRSNLGAATLRAGHPAATVRLLADDVTGPDALPESIFLMATALRKLGHEREARAVLQRYQIAAQR
ncbi:MAG TPA: tetratricopeptide repeat protein [Polyangiaceae bacterium]